MKENCSLTGALFMALFFCPRHLHVNTNFPTGSTVVHILIIVFVPSTCLMWWQSWRDTDEGHWGDEDETGVPRVQIHAASVESPVVHVRTGSVFSGVADDISIPKRTYVSWCRLKSELSRLAPGAYSRATTSTFTHLLRWMTAVRKECLLLLIGWYYFHWMKPFSKA